MWFIEAFSIILLAALCTAQDADENATTLSDLPMTTLLPMSSVTPALSVDPPAAHIYRGERVNLHCDATGNTPDWTYQWFHNNSQGTPLHSAEPTSTEHTITADDGTYWCRIKRGEELSPFSNDISLTIIDPPTPSLEVQTQWLDVFPSEKVKMSCGVQGSSDWTFTWYKDGQRLSADSSVSLDAEGMSLTILSATQTHQGLYSCKSHHKTRNITSGPSKSADITVHPNKPKPLMTQYPSAEKIYIGEPVFFGCKVDVSTDWEYLWFKDGASLSNSGNSYNISSATSSDSGTYKCMAKRGTTTFNTEYSEVQTQISAIPVPTLMPMTPWSDVFPSEKVEMSCGVQGSSDWTFTWYRDGQKLNEDSTVSLGPEGSTVTVSPPSRTYTGKYSCRGHHKKKRVNTGDSNTFDLKVYENKPQPRVTQTPGLKEIYIGEPVSFSCMVDKSSGWEYIWYRNGTEFNTSSNYNITSPKPSNSGQYRCRAKRGKGPFYTDKSEIKSLQLSDPPKPSLEVQTQRLDVFPTERIEMSCGVQGNSDWTFTWYRDGQKVSEVSSVSLDAEGMSLTILSATQTHKGLYTCKSHHKARNISSGPSNSADITVHQNRPKSTLSKNPGFDQMYVGESVTFSCEVDVSSGWEYLWFKDGKQLITSDSSKSYNISSPASSDGGIYTCKGKRGKHEFFANDSETISLKIIEIPVPSLELQTPWLDVFPAERVEMSCGVQGSSDWTYTWHRDGHEPSGDHISVSPGAEGTSLIISSAKHEDIGTYTCRGQHRTRPVKTQSSNKLILFVYANKPKPLMTQDPSVEKMYIGEPVSFGCKVDNSTGWEYLWYKDRASLSISGNSYNISSAASSDNGTYKCMAKRGTTAFNTDDSKVRTLQISAIPVPSLKLMTAWSDVFPTETVELSCGVPDSSDWTYTWYRNRTQMQLDTSSSLDSDRATLSIQSASAIHAGEYECMGRHKSRSVSTGNSSGSNLTVYDEMPKAVLKQGPEYNVMYIGESVNFSCDVTVSSGWEYQLYKDKSPLFTSRHSHSISSVVQTNKGGYQCQATRGKKKKIHTEFSEARNLDIHVRPWAVMTLLTGWSEVFSTDTLVLRCEVKGSQSQDQWNYTWYREGNHLGPSDIHTVTPQDDPDQSQYTCKGIRFGRPSYSTLSDAFKTKNLLLKRRVLLSISGCLFFGIIVVFIGCIALRLTRKPDQNAEKPEEPNLFLTMAELKTCDDAPCPLDDYDRVTEVTLTASNKETEDDEVICSESTPLPITSPEDQAVTSESPDTTDGNGGMISFKQ